MPSPGPAAAGADAGGSRHEHRYLRPLVLRHRVAAGRGVAVRSVHAPEEILPFVDTIRVRKRLRPPVSDQDDHKFLECAVAGRAEYLVTGDKELRGLGTYRGVTILNVAEFLSVLGR